MSPTFEECWNTPANASGTRLIQVVQPASHHPHPIVPNLRWINVSTVITVLISLLWLQSSFAARIQDGQFRAGSLTIRPMRAPCTMSR